MFCAFLLWFEEISPFLTNVYLSYLAYCAVERHAYSVLVGVGVYFVLNEFDSIKRHFVMYRMGWR
jgi:hypothetical protein